MTPRLNGWMVALLLGGVAAYAIAEEITLTTYYPSPRGVYDQLRTAGNVQIGRIDPPAVAADAPRLHVVRRNADTDPEDTGFPAFLVEDEIPNANTPDPTPFVIDEDGNVGIGTTNPAAALDVTSTTRGFLPPRMDTGQRDAIDPRATGMVIFNTQTNELEMYKGTAWIPVRQRNCPAGYLDVGSFCIETGQRTAANWWTATTTCQAADAELCQASKWYAACEANRTGSLPGLNNMLDGWEWLSDMHTFSQVGQGVLLGLIQVGVQPCRHTDVANVGDQYPYRCCLSQ